MDGQLVYQVLQSFMWPWTMNYVSYVYSDMGLTTQTNH